MATVEVIQPPYASSTNPLETIPTDRNNAYHGKYIPNTPLGASLVSFLLGIHVCLGIILFARPDDDRLRWAPMGFFLAAWSAFHWGEFAVAAGWNRSRCSVDSFLLENGSMYHIAHAVAVTEFVLTTFFAPNLQTICFLRSTAMIHASSNFSHQIATRKDDDHKLVTTGVYAWLRHPSYTGFFYWSLGTQVALQNPISFIGFAIVLWRFFRNRIKVEERYLIRFFGSDYEVYRKKVGTWIPFVR
ncbi:hypothetical protein BS47DRAFT_1454323 [Hydnum rufescens UP504]|uniref:Protein-S-isoprenylcysteine O-methyltransferase n=1 Tax=Hydnum rufescens UP504 TaxID=1448309 RepID=A0A9P6AYD6_9AGAM|nr:hypothetical protein BS47DRAFT_1454323 [Hydnum rufescens UP504]